MLHLHPTYNILSARDGDSKRRLTVVKRKLSLLYPYFDIGSDNDHYALKDINMIARTLTLSKNGSVVATLYAENLIMSLADIYGIEIVDDEDQPFHLALFLFLRKCYMATCTARMSKNYMKYS